MSTSIAVLGRQPAIGLAELEALFGADAVQRVGAEAASIDLPADQIDFKRLGGTMKLAKLLTILDFTDWQKIEDYLAEELPKHTCCITEGKFTLGLSLYGFKINPKRVNATGLSLKKVIKATDRPVRIVPNKSLELSSAQVLHNKLFTSHNWELLLIRDEGKTYLAQTTNVQDIEAYAARDQARPARDAKVGMLPPKLAQTLINLAVGKLESNEQQAMNNEVTVLDPFCGTGVVLQEALLMGYDVIGTDLDQRMVEYSQINLKWLQEKWNLEDTAWEAEAGDATDHQWPELSALSSQHSAYVACETYLGRPFSSAPNHATLQKVMQDVDTIHEKFLKNVAQQTQKGFRMCIAIPAWRVGRSFKHLKVLDSLGGIGYTRVSFAHARDEDLIYHRESQFVGRELVVLERN